MIITRHNNLFRSSILIIFIGILCRYLISLRGYNFDFESFVIVADLATSGENIYAATPRYNYGPIWFHFLRILFQISSRNEVYFRYYIITFLVLVDLSIFIVLYREFGKFTAYIFFLNPISVIITGFHNQFDNLALLLGMLASISFGDDFDGELTRRKIIGLIVLGISITSKHILFLFPVWLAIKQKGIISKMAVISLPYLIFMMSLIPYWEVGRNGILENVFLYRSYNNSYFYNFFVPAFAKPLISATALWVVGIILFGYIFRKAKGIPALLLYTCILLVMSPAMANQYLAIAIPYVSVFLNPFTLAFGLVGSVFLLIDINGLNMFHQGVSGYVMEYQHGFYPLLLVLLGLGLLRHYAFQLIIGWVKWIGQKVKWTQ